MPKEFNWDYWRSLQGGPQEVPVEVLEAGPQPRDVPGQITQGLTPGVWATLGVPRQGSGPEQAIAEYEARASMPRSDVWGQTLTEDRPENLYQELLAPFQRGLRTGMNAFKPVAEKTPQSRNVGGALVERNSLTGEWDVKIPATPKLDARTRSQIKDFESEIASKRRGLDDPLISLLPKLREQKEGEIAALKAKKDALFDDGTPVSNPARGLETQSPFSYIGTNRMESVPSQSKTAPGDIPAHYISYLRANPQSAASFDKIYGVGAAKAILRQ